jgi:hypothetical protein
MALTYQELLLGHPIVSRRDRRCEKCAVSHDDEDSVRVRREAATAILSGGAAVSCPHSRRRANQYFARVYGHDDSRYAAFILKWLTPHSVPSA